MNFSHFKQPFQASFYYGWVIVAVSAVTLFFSGPGQTYSVSLFIDSYIHEFGWSRSLVSGIYSSATLLAGVIILFIGRLIDRVGHRNISVIVGVLLAVACFLSSIVSNPIMLFLGFFMLRLFGQGSMTLVPNTLVPQWFYKKRGRAMSFMAIGGFLSSAMFPLVNAWIIGEFSWRAAWTVWGAALLIVFVPLAWLLIRNRPEDLGLLPDNESSVEKPEAEKMIDPAKFGQDWTLTEASKTKAFWILLLCSAIPAMINTGLAFHLVSILGEQGIETGTAALILSMVAIVGFPVTMVAGFILEIVSVHYMLALVFAGELIVVALLLFVKTVPIAILFGLLWGLVGGFERIVLGIIWPNYFGRKHLGSIHGIAVTATVIGSALGPLPFGVAYDFFGTYRQILLLMMAIPIFGIVGSLLSPPPDYIYEDDIT